MKEIVSPEYIRLCRNALDLSQKACADCIGVSLTTFKDYEKRGDLWLLQAIKLTEFFKQEAKTRKIDLMVFDGIQ